MCVCVCVSFPRRPCPRRRSLPREYPKLTRGRRARNQLFAPPPATVRNGPRDLAPHHSDPSLYLSVVVDLPAAGAHISVGKARVHLPQGTIVVFFRPNHIDDERVGERGRAAYGQRRIP